MTVPRLSLVAGLVLSFTSAQAEIKALRLVSYNIQGARRGLSAVQRTLSRLQPQLVALQEVHRRDRSSGRVDQARWIARKLGWSNYLYCPHRYRRTHGVALLSRYRLETRRCHKTAGSFLGFLEAVADTPGGKLRVLVVHLHPTNPFRASTKRRRSDARRSKEARAVYRVAANKGAALAARTIVLGDFNDDTGSPTYDLFARAFADACDVAGGLYEKTWPSWLPVTRIDFAFVSKALRVVRCHAVASRASDHLPIYIDLQAR